MTNALAVKMYAAMLAQIVALQELTAAIQSLEASILSIDASLLTINTKMGGGLPPALTGGKLRVTGLL